jgi:hypothetical protein
MRNSRLSFRVAAATFLASCRPASAVCPGIADLGRGLGGGRPHALLSAVQLSDQVSPAVRLLPQPLTHRFMLGRQLP